MEITLRPVTLELLKGEEEVVVERPNRKFQALARASQGRRLSIAWDYGKQQPVCDYKDCGKRLLSIRKTNQINLQLGSRVKAFGSFSQFEVLARLAADLGKQAGGWNKGKTPRGQNGGAAAPSQRAQILSTRAASLVEAKP